MECPIRLDRTHCENCYFWRDGKCDYKARGVKGYCPICKRLTTLISQSSGWFCSVCGYKKGTWQKSKLVKGGELWKNW